MGEVKNYVNFYKGSLDSYNNLNDSDIDENGVYFVDDENTNEKSIYIGKDKYSDTKVGWENSLKVDVSTGSLQQVSKDSTNYSEHFNNELESLHGELDDNFLNYVYRENKKLVCFSNFNDMKECRYLLAGMTAFVKGINLENDGGSSLFHVRSYNLENDEIDGYSLILLENGNVAERIDFGGVSSYSTSKEYYPGEIIYYDSNLYVCIYENGPIHSDINSPLRSYYWKKITFTSIEDGSSFGGVASFNSSGKLVFPDGSLLWVE